MISLRTEHLKRYGDIARLLIKYGRSDLVQDMGVKVDIPEPDEEREAPPAAHELADDLQKMGPTFVKLGQLLSTQTAFLPKEYAEVLSQLQDDVDPFPFEEAEEIIRAELGVRISKAFREFDEVPIAAASLAQVHRAVTRDGRSVAVKVQRPDVKDVIVADLEILEEVATFLDKHTDLGQRYAVLRNVDDLRQSLMRELDYYQEANNLNMMAENLRQFENILIPRAVPDYSSSRVLTMDYMQGRKITDLTPLRLIELDATDLADELFRAYLKQILVDGLVHSDPHPGNVFLTEDGRIALLDLGMVGRVPPQLQGDLVKFLLALSEGRGEDAAEVAFRIGKPLPDFDREQFNHQVANLVITYSNASVEQMTEGSLIMDVARIAGESGIQLPTPFTMLGKTLLKLDRIARTLAPSFNPSESIRRNAHDLLQQHIRKSLSLGQIYHAFLEGTEFLQNLPTRLNNFFDLLAENRLRMDIDAIDEDRLISGLQKIANRITLGLILAALIIGAAMLMNVETEFQIFGYPGFAMILFCFAAIGGIWLVFRIIWSDEHFKK